MRTHLLRSTAAAVVVVVFGGALCAAQQPPPQDYQIKLHRNAVVGQKFMLAMSAEQSQTMVLTVDGQAGPAEDMAMALELTGHVTTLAVSPTGRETRLSLAIEQSKCSADGITSPVLPPGTVVIVARDTEMTTFTVNDSPVNPRAARCLKLALPSSGSEQSNDDAIFGTRARQKVGGAWPMNSALAAEDLMRTAGLQVAARDVTGTTRLAEVTSFNDQPALRLSGEMIMKNVTVPLPPAVKVTVKSSEFRASLSAVLPVDPARTDGQMGMKITGRIECDAEAGGHTIHMVVMMNQRTEHTLTAEKSTDGGR